MISLRPAPMEADEIIMLPSVNFLLIKRQAAAVGIKIIALIV